jgi:hypothetical protein
MAMVWMTFNNIKLLLLFLKTRTEKNPSTYIPEWPDGIKQMCQQQLDPQVQVHHK